jgi:cobalt-zinc-cadmium efflux system outer membrane protein
MLQNHTDILTARYNLQGSNYNLKLARVIPVPDVEIRGDIWKENTIFPLQNFHMMTISIPFPVWDQNKGNIRAAAAAMVRASEGTHVAELNLTTNLASAYGLYKSNLAALEYYRRNILPDQVRYYRGVFERRKIDPGAAFADLVQAQQTLVADVTAYLGVLSTLWTSVVNVADFLQTDDLYQLGKPIELPRLPDLDALHAWSCPHPLLSSSPAASLPAPTSIPHMGAKSSTRMSEGSTPTQRPDTAVVNVSTGASSPGTPPAQPAGAPTQTPPNAERTPGVSDAGKAIRAYYTKYLGLPPLPFAPATPVADQPVAQAFGPIAQDPSRRSSAISLWSSQ